MLASWSAATWRWMKVIALYERGAALKARCEAKLKEAEEKVAKITLGEGGHLSARHRSMANPLENIKSLR